MSGSEVSVPLRVAYYETDQMGVAHHANYLLWFETGRTEFCRRKGIPYREIELQTRSYLVVVEAFCRYLRPLRYDVEFVVRTTVREVRRRSVKFHYRLTDPSGDTVYAEGYTLHIVTGPDGRPKVFPDHLKEVLQGSSLDGS